MRKMKQNWTPIPLRWFSDPEFLELSEVTLKMLLLLWARSESGEVPKCERKARALAGLPIKPARAKKALMELEEAGFLVDSGSVFFLAHWGHVFRQSSAKMAQRRKKSPGGIPNIPKGSAPHSRARNLSPSGRDKREEREGASLRGRPSLSEKENNEQTKRALEILEEVRR